MSWLLRGIRAAARLAAYIVYRTLEAGGLCIVFSLLPFWVACHASLVACSLVWQLILSDALAIISTLYRHQWSDCSALDVAVTDLVHFTKYQPMLWQRVENARISACNYEESFRSTYHPPVSFLEAFKATSAAWVDLHEDPPFARLDTATELSIICTPDGTRTAPSIHWPALLAIGLSLLPTPLALLDSHINQHGLADFHPFMDSLSHLVSVTLRLYYLSFMYRLRGGDSTPSTSAVLTSGHNDALERYIVALEALVIDADGHPSTVYADRGFVLVRLTARAEMLKKEERRVEAREFDGLMLVLHRWKDERLRQRRMSRGGRKRQDPDCAIM